MKKLSALCLLVVLAACATPQEIEAQKQAQDKADFDTCVSYGLRPGSEAFGMCRLELDLARQQQYNNWRYRGSYHHHPHYRGGGFGVGLGF